MNLISSASSYLAASAVSIGMFDGLHMGHRAVLGTLRQVGQRCELPSVVVTFDPHPKALLRPDDAPLMLTSLDRRLQLLDESGLVDHCLVMKFDSVLAARSAEAFVDQILVEKLGIRHLVVGENFCCGAKRQGNVPLLQTLGQSRGFDVAGLPLSPIASGINPTCSSTNIRLLVREGKLDEAAIALGRPHVVEASVRSVGESAVHLELPNQICLPPSGSHVVVMRSSRGSEKADSSFGDAGVLHLADERRASLQLFSDGASNARAGDSVHVYFTGRSSLEAEDQGVHLRASLRPSRQRPDPRRRAGSTNHREAAYPSVA